MTVGPGAPGAEGTPAPAGGAPAPGEGRDPAEMLGEAVGSGNGAEGGSAEGNEDITDWKAEAEKWKGLSRKNEQRAKDNSAAAKKLADIEQANMTEVEKANARAQAAEETAAASDQRYFRTMAAAKHDLPVELIEDLGSGTEEEIDARAERLANVIRERSGQGSGPAPVNGGVGPQFRTGRPVEALRPGGAPAGNGQPKNSNDLFRELINRPGQ